MRNKILGTLAGIVLSTGALAQNASFIAKDEGSISRLEHYMKNDYSDFFFRIEDNGFTRIKSNYFLHKNFGISADYFKPIPGTSQFDLGVTGMYLKKNDDSFFKSELNLYPVNRRGFWVNMYKNKNFQFDNISVFSRQSLVNITSALYNINTSWSLGFESQFINDDLIYAGPKIKFIPKY